MSRIGKNPIPIPDKVNVTVDGKHVTVKGPKGELEQLLPDHVEVVQEDGNVIVRRLGESRKARERHGLSRSLVANMVQGVSQGYEKRLTVQGVGYRAQVQGTTLVLNVGYSHPIEIQPPDGVQFQVAERNTEIVITGINKEIVGNLAAQIRAVRPPEVYKGKGIRYKGEYVRQKAGKAGKK
ncbi:50S ribosomal protein L6 [Spirulina sp. CS-785/01]|uniref:50S ribosomal protein L6 n=1 Tax=Spirulina sp. CS-785/01 TaxID=3021716 RepID=UPI00232FC449|nr:50S ribosomal protein L6 [Spirulina sp. CS-785/01]MDB9312272.1 50S ribosomal protein L6 [Spirulina sp. CS-785/01]